MMSPDELEMPDLIIEAYGTVTPPPPPQQPCPDEGEEETQP